MAAATKMEIIDGHLYNIGDELPELGSLACINEDNNKREYRGLKADFSKLPKYDDLATGSSCLFLDTGEYAEYLAYNKTWYLV